MKVMGQLCLIWISLVYIVAAVSALDVFPCGILHRTVTDECEQRVYQSALRQSITINGTGFRHSLVLTFNPPLFAGIDYSLEVVDSNTVELHLLEGRKWRPSHGLLYITALRDDSQTQQYNGLGVFVAVVYDDPIIAAPASPKLYHETQSKRIDIEVSGFPQSYPSMDPTSHYFRSVFSANFTPIVAEHFTVESNVIGVLLTLTLKRNSDKGWLPPELSFRNDPEGADKQIPVMISSINTGAGDIALTPTLIGYVVQDREGVLCEDTCSGAANGRCNDGSLDGAHGAGALYCVLGTDCEDCGMQRKLWHWEQPMSDNYSPTIVHTSDDDDY